MKNYHNTISFKIFEKRKNLQRYHLLIKDSRQVGATSYIVTSLLYELLKSSNKSFLYIGIENKNSNKIKDRAKLHLIPKNNILVASHKVYEHLLIGKKFDMVFLDEAITSEEELLLVAQHCTSNARITIVCNKEEGFIEKLSSKTWKTQLLVDRRR